MKTNNSKLFPNNIFPVEKVSIEGGYYGESTYKIYTARFENLYDLHRYLTSNPEINRSIFQELSSENKEQSFAGKPYEEAVADLLKDHDPGYDYFLELQANINQSLGANKRRYTPTRKVVGNHIILPAYAAGSPKCYMGLEKVNEAKFIRMHVTLSYFWNTSKEQVFNRALIITNLIKALENKGYTVDLHAFSLAEESDELINIILKLKRFDGTLDMDALYKSLCRVEFLRRILFRIRETMDVENSWGEGYGRTCTENFTRGLLRLDDNDIFIDQPSNLGIGGYNLADDFENTIESLKIQDKIDVDKAIANMRTQAKILKR